MENAISAVYHNPWLLALVILWSLTWKAVATWHAARNGQLPWFIALFIINTVGILEIIYLLFFRARKDRQLH